MLSIIVNDLNEVWLWLYIHFKSTAGLTAIIVWNQQMVLGLQNPHKQCKAEGKCVNLPFFKSLDLLE